MYRINNIDVTGFFFIYRATRKLIFACLTEKLEFYENGKLYGDQMQ